jgi:hypothetical protein
LPKLGDKLLLLQISQGIAGQANGHRLTQMTTDNLSSPALKSGAEQMMSSPSEYFVNSISKKILRKDNKRRTLMCHNCGNKLERLICKKCKSVIKIRQHILTDFLIGAYAFDLDGHTIVTNDKGYYSCYFPELNITTVE